MARFSEVFALSFLSSIQPFQFLLPPALCAGAFVQALTGGIQSIPVPLRLSLVLLFAGLGYSQDPNAWTGTSLGASLFAGAVAGITLTMPLRGLAAGARRGVATVAPGAEELTDASVVVGTMAWLEAGGVGSILNGFWAAREAATQWSAVSMEPSEIIRVLGALFFSGFLSGALPCFAFALGTAIFLGLIQLGKGKASWQPLMTLVVGLLFLGVWIRGVPKQAGVSLDAGTTALLRGR